MYLIVNTLMFKVIAKKSGSDYDIWASYSWIENGTSKYATTDKINVINEVYLDKTIYYANPIGDAAYSVDVELTYTQKEYSVIAKKEGSDQDTWATYDFLDNHSHINKNINTSEINIISEEIIGTKKYSHPNPIGDVQYTVQVKLTYIEKL